MGLGLRARRSSSAVGTAARKALQTADTLCSCRMLRCSSMCGNRSGETRISATTREGTKGRTRVVRFAWRDVLSGGVGTRRRGGFLRSGVSVDWPGACTRADLRGSMRSRRLLALRRVSTIARERVGNNEGPEKLSHFRWAYWKLTHGVAAMFAQRVQGRHGTAPRASTARAPE